MRILAMVHLVQMDSPSPRQLHRLGLLAARLERPSEEGAL